MKAVRSRRVPPASRALFVLALTRSARGLALRCTSDCELTVELKLAAGTIEGQSFACIWDTHSKLDFS